jgi:arginine decarboxylase
MIVKTQSLASTAGLKQGLFSASEARFDRWCELSHAAESLVATAQTGKPSMEARTQVEQLLAALEPLETLHAYPGEGLMAALKDLLGRGDFTSFCRLATRISKALLNGTFRRSASAWKAGEEAEGESGERILKDYFEGEDLAKPYFEVLIVSDDGTPEQIRQVRNEWRKFRRPEDPFVYEIVVATSFEDAVLGAVLNPNIQAIIIHDNFRFQTRLHAPLLRDYLQQHLKLEAAAVAPQDYGVTLAKTIRAFRPELDVYLVVDRGIEKLASHLDSKNIRRIFYGIEDLMELHLAIFEGVNDRYDTPYFNNLKNYARKPMGTFHALPIARGK